MYRSLAHTQDEEIRARVALSSLILRSEIFNDPPPRRECIVIIARLIVSRQWIRHYQILMIYRIPCTNEEFNCANL